MNNKKLLCSLYHCRYNLNKLWDLINAWMNRAGVQCATLQRESLVVVYFICIHEVLQTYQTLFLKEAIFSFGARLQRSEGERAWLDDPHQSATSRSVTMVLSYQYTIQFQPIRAQGFHCAARAGEYKRGRLQV